MTESIQTRTDPALLFEKANGVATLTLNRPATRNALTTGMFLDMERLLIEIEADDTVRVVVITGTGRGFSSGADLKPESDAERERTRKASFPGDQGGDILDRGNRCMLRLHRLPKPVIGSINGDAVGIGCSLALARRTCESLRTRRALESYSLAVGSGPMAVPRISYAISSDRRRHSNSCTSATSSTRPRLCESGS